MKQNPNPAAKFPIERSVWHGTSNDAVSSIQIHGFNRSYAGDKNGKHVHCQNAVTVTYIKGRLLKRAVVLVNCVTLHKRDF